MIEKDLKKPPVQARSKETVKAILEAAARILGREGLAKVSTNRIAEVAGVSVGSLYQFFRNKNSILSELYGSALETGLARLLRSIELTRAADGTPELRPFVERLVGIVFENITNEGAVQRALIQEAPELIGLETMREFDARIAPVLVDFLRESKLAIRELDLETAVFVLIQTVRGVAVASVFQRVEPARVERIKAELVEICVRYLSSE